MQSEQRNGKRKRRRHSAEFKAGAVRLVLEEGKTPAQVGRDLDVHQTLVGAWVKQAKADAGKGPPGALTTAEKDELTRLRKRVRELEIERTILKKAAAFFAKENG